MPIHAYIDPGLLIYDSLESHQIEIAFRSFNSLSLHKKKIDETGALIPVTFDYYARIFAGLNNIKIKNPPLERNLRAFIVELLGKRATDTQLLSAKVTCLSLVPDLGSDWIDENARELWKDCIASSTYERLAGKEENTKDIKPTMATWSRADLPFEVICSCPEVCQSLEIDPKTEWAIPVLATQQDWDEFQVESLPWPAGLNNIRIEKYARKSLGIPNDQLPNRLEVEFTKPSYHDICKEDNPEIMKAIIESIACKAYNCLRPDQVDETIKDQPNMRRLYVKKMAPVVRLHYYLKDKKLIITMYSNGKHNKGL